jgi:riboflavin kinase / FMN adenylyltransferase
VSRRVVLAENLPELPSGCLVVIGNFDGVHAGHRAVLEIAVREARAAALAPLVLTFDPHPAVVLRDAKPSVLTAMARRIELIQRLFPEISVAVQTFSLALSKLGAREFVADLLVSELGARVVVVGENFRFGQGREGDVARLEALGTELGFRAHALALRGDDAGAFSSSRVRALLAQGALAEAKRILGRPHALSGRVIEGDRRGRTIGFPTANLGEVQEVLPPHGVYACLVDRLDADGRARALARGVANVGVRPTVQAGLSVEAHLIDWSGEIYGESLRLHLIERLRDERRFDGLDALVQQIGQDVAAARQILASAEPDAALGGAWH